MLNVLHRNSIAIPNALNIQEKNIGYLASKQNIEFLCNTLSIRYDGVPYNVISFVLQGATGLASIRYPYGLRLSKNNLE